MVHFFVFFLFFFKFSLNYHYEREITLNKISPSQSFKITINTLELINQGKMNEECDILLENRNNLTNAYIYYWLESGCNTTYTTYWINYANFQGKENLTIHMSYSPFTQANNVILQINSFQVFSLSECNTLDGWNTPVLQDSSHEDRFFSVSDSTHFNNHIHGPGHVHTLSESGSEVVRTLTESMGTEIYQGENGPLEKPVMTIHNHETISRSSEIVSSEEFLVPKHMYVGVCSKRGHIKYFPENSIVMIDDAQNLSEAEEKGWSVFNEPDGLFLRATLNSSKFGTIHNGGHTHTFNLGEDLREGLTWSTNLRLTHDSGSITVTSSGYHKIMGQGHDWIASSGPSSRSYVPDHSTFILLISNGKALPFTGMMISSTSEPWFGYRKESVGPPHTPIRACISDPSYAVEGNPEAHVHSPINYDNIGFPKEDPLSYVNPGSGSSSSGAGHSHFTNHPSNPTVTESVVPSRFVEEVGLLFFTRFDYNEVLIGEEVLVRKHQCYGFEYDDSRVCTEGKGDCVSEDVCSCDRINHPGYYGKKCAEYIEDNAVFQSMSIISIGWIAELEDVTTTVNETDVQSVVSKRFPCHKVILNKKEVFGNTPIFCSWELPQLVISSSLYIWFKKTQTVESLSVLMNATLYLKPLTAHQNSTEVVKVILIPPQTKSKNDLTDLILYIVIPSAVIFFILVACLVMWVVIFIVVVIIYGSRQKKIKKFKKLDDLDVILKEMEVEGDHFSKIKISKNAWKIERSEIKLLEELGSGGSGCKVFLVEWRGIKCAYKNFRVLDIIDQHDFEEMEREITLMGSIRHPHVLEMFGASIKLPSIGILLPFCSNGDVYTFLMKRKKYPLSQRIRMVKEIVHAMKHIHSLKILHRDLKSQNVLVSKTEEMKVMDFGLSKCINSSLDKKQTKRVGTANYMAPEVTLGRKYSYPADVFSFGILSYEILSSDFSPFKHLIDVKDFSINMEMKIANDPFFRPNVKELEKLNIPKWLINLVKECWEEDEANRKDFVEIEKVLLHNLEKMENTIKEKDVKESKNVYEELEMLRRRLKKVKINGDKEVMLNDIKIRKIKEKKE